MQEIGVELADLERVTVAVDQTVVELAARHRLPAMYEVPAYVEAGGHVMRDLFSTDEDGWLQDPALVELLVTLAVLYAFWRRFVLKPRRLEPNREALLVLSLAGFEGGPYFGLLAFMQVPITFIERTVGRSKMTYGIVIEALWLVTLWGVRSYRSAWPPARRARM